MANGDRRTISKAMMENFNCLLCSIDRNSLLPEWIRKNDNSGTAHKPLKPLIRGIKKYKRYTITDE